MEKNDKKPAEKKPEESLKKGEQTSVNESTAHHTKTPNPQRREGWNNWPVAWHNKEEGAE